MYGPLQTRLYIYIYICMYVCIKPKLRENSITIIIEFAFISFP